MIICYIKTSVNTRYFLDILLEITVILRYNKSTRHERGCYMKVLTDKDFSIDRAKRSDVTFVSDSHYHDNYEIYYLVSGTRRQFVNHNIYDMKKGDMILIPKRVIHKTTAIEKNPHMRYVLNFSDSFSESIFRGLASDTPESVFKAVKISVPESRREYVLGLFEKMYEESITESTDEYSAIMIKNYLSELFVFINRYNKKSNSHSTPENFPEERIQKAAKFIYDNFDKSITLSDAASHIYMSESYFSKKFKKVTGLNFGEYLTSIRIKMAEEMLFETKKSIAEIAELSGFRDANYFGDVFKKEKGISPNKYRKLKSRP